MDNSILLQGILNSLSKVTAEKTSPAFAQMVVETILQSLQRKFSFLSNVRFESNIYVPKEVNDLEERELAKAIEAIIRLVYMKLEKQAGLFFISELEKYAEPGIIPQIRNIGVDLELMQIEHHQLYRDKSSSSGQASMNFINGQPASKETFDNDKSCEPSSEELKLLQLLHQKDIDETEAINVLNISAEELDDMIVKLLNNELLHYVSENEVKLTRKAISYLSDKQRAI
jgi:hypothetical protein